MTRARQFDLEPLDATFGATVSGLKVTDVDEKTFGQLYDAWLEYALLIFPGQHLSNDEQVAFAKRFGKLEFDLMAISNVGSDGAVRYDESVDVVKVLKGNLGWHHDSTFMPVQAKGAVFCAEVVPSSGGETEWADMRAAYDVLDDEMRELIGGLSAYHSIYYSQAKIGHTPEKGSGYSGYGFHDLDPPLRPLVKTHSETGRKTLTIGRHAYGIPGMDTGASERLLEELADFACRPPRVWRHRWTSGDAVVWDNRCLMHRGREWDMKEPRVMYHSRIAGDAAAEFAASA